MGMFFGSNKLRMPAPGEALPGRQTALRVADTHFVNGHRITPPFPDGMQRAIFGMGCFWGAERKFWQTPGVYTTAVLNTPSVDQNMRSAPQKQPMPKIAVCMPSGTGGTMAWPLM